MTNQAASSTSSRFYLANTHVPKGFHLPGITDDARHALAECLEDDYNHHHVYFNDKKGFHNHLTHHLLAAFSLGAGADRLRAIHALQSRRQLPLKPAHRSGDQFDPDQHWGDDNYYHDYLDYFTREVEQRDGGDGRRTAERWLFGEEELGRRNQFYARFLGGAYHPFIHLGYGLEYNLNCMIAEGLAQVAVHSPQVAALIAEVDENAAPGSKSAKEVAVAVAADAALDPVKKFELGSTRLKLTALLAQGGGPIVRAHAAQWACPTDKVYEKAHELQQLAVAVMAGAVRPEKKVVFDFFLMHAVTSSIFLPTYVRSLQPENAARLLRDKLAVDLGHFVSRGRPELNLDQLLTYQPRKPELSGHENAWFGVWDEVLDQAKYQDEHIIKTVRALSYADQHHHDIGFLKQETYAHVALMLLDNVASVNDWEFDGVGFERVWKEWPDRH